MWPCGRGLVPRRALHQPVLHNAEHGLPHHLRVAPPRCAPTHERELVPLCIRARQLQQRGVHLAMALPLLPQPDPIPCDGVGAGVHLQRVGIAEDGGSPYIDTAAVMVLVADGDHGMLLSCKPLRVALGVAPGVKKTNLLPRDFSLGCVLQPTRRGSWAPHGLCVSRGGGVKTGATLPWPFSGWSLQFVCAVLTRRSPIGGSGCQGCGGRDDRSTTEATQERKAPGLDAGATADYIAWPSKDGKPQRPGAGQGSGPRAAPQPRGRRDTPRPWGAFRGFRVSRTQPDSERPLVLPPGAQRAAEPPHEGDGG